MVARSNAAARLSGPPEVGPVEAASCRLHRNSAGRWEIAAASDRFLELIGRSRDVILGAPALALLGLEKSGLDLDGVHAQEAALETKIALHLPEGRSIVRATLVPLTGTGDAPGEILALFRSAAADGKSVVHEELAASETPVDVFVRYSTDLTFIDCSEGYAALYGVTPADLI